MKLDLWFRPALMICRNLFMRATADLRYLVNRRPRAQWPPLSGPPLGTVVCGSAVACSSSGRQQLFPLCPSTPIRGRTQAASTGPRTARREVTEERGGVPRGDSRQLRGVRWWEGIAPPPIRPLSCSYVSRSHEEWEPPAATGPCQRIAVSARGGPHGGNGG